VQLTVVGGSSVATVQLADALATWPSELPLTVVLQGRDTAKLAAVQQRSAAVLADRSGTPVSLRAESDLATALVDADIVLVQIRVGGLAARAFDETFPWTADLPGEETLGPGGFANALRTVAAVGPLWRTVAAVCPQALVVVLTNPAGIVRRAAAAAGLTAVEVCDSPLTHLADLAQRLGRPADALTGGYVGMNHVGWWVPGSPGDLEAVAAGSPVDADVVAAYGASPLPYLRYYAHPERQREAQRDQAPRAEHLMSVERAALSALAESRSPDPTARPAPWYTLGVVPLLRAWAGAGDTRTVLGAANGARLAGLDADATVEGPTWVRHRSILPEPPAALPAVADSLLRRHAAYEELALHAAAERTSVSLLRALLVNPMVPSADRARRLVAALVDADPASSALPPLDAA